MNINDISIFVDVAKTGTLTSVANRRGVSQPAISRSLSDFEQELGVRLFDRIGRTLCLNAAGEAVLPYARSILNSCRNLSANLADLGGPSLQVVRIGVSAGHTRWLSDSILWFSKTYPEISLRLLKMEPDRLLQQLLDGDFDFGISSIDYKNPHINCMPLYSEEIGVLLSRNHPLAVKDVISIYELEKEAFFLTARNSDIRRFTNELCAQAGFAPNIHLELDLPGTVEELRYLRNGVSFISPDGFRHMPLDDGIPRDCHWTNLLTYRPLAESFCRRTYYLCVPTSQYLLSACRELIQRIRSSRELPEDTI